MGSPNRKPTVAVHKFSSCDGCQLAFLNMGPDLLKLAERVELLHFAEAGPVAPDVEVDVSFVEGSVATPEDVERIRRIREQSKTLIAIGACATSGGVQALRNGTRGVHWLASLYQHPEHIESLPDSMPVSAHVKVDYELFGCPVTSEQVMATVNSLLLGVAPHVTNEKVCVECKRHGYTCVMVSKGMACMGPVTHGGCGALCPSLGRDCYGCFGPGDVANTDSLVQRFKSLGLDNEAIARRFQFINSQAPACSAAAAKIVGGND